MYAALLFNNRKHQIDCHHVNDSEQLPDSERILCTAMLLGILHDKIASRTSQLDGLVPSSALEIPLIKQVIKLGSQEFLSLQEPLYELYKEDGEIYFPPALSLLVLISPNPISR